MSAQATSPARARIVVADFVEPFVQGRLRRHEIVPLTATNERSHLHGLSNLIGEIPVAEITRVEAAQYLESLHGLAPATRRRRWSTVRSFFRWLLAEGYIAADPAVGLASPKEPRSVPRALSGEEVARLLRSLPDARAKIIVSLMLYLGLRCHEVAGLRYDDISGESVRIMGKGNHERILPLLPEVMVAIEEYEAEDPTERGGHVVRSRRRDALDGQGLGADTISGMVSRWMKAAGVQTGPRDGRSAHALRHSCASDMMKNGAFLRDIQRALGHSTLTTTERYLVLEVDGLAEAMGGRHYGEASESAELAPLDVPIRGPLPDAVGPLIDAVAALMTMVRQLESRIENWPDGPPVRAVVHAASTTEETESTAARAGRALYARVPCPDCGSAHARVGLHRHRVAAHGYRHDPQPVGCEWYSEPHLHTIGGGCVCPICEKEVHPVWCFRGHVENVRHTKCPDCDRSFVRLDIHRRSKHRWAAPAKVR